MNVMRRHFNFKATLFIPALCAALCLFSGAGPARAEAVPAELAPLLPDDIPQEFRENIIRRYAETVEAAAAAAAKAAAAREEFLRELRQFAALSPEERQKIWLRSINSNAESDIRNLKTAEEVLMGDELTYGATRQGTPPPGTGAGRGDLLTGPLRAATSDEGGAMVSGTLKDGTKKWVSHAVANGVSIQATTIAENTLDIKAVVSEGAKNYYAVSKHRDGNQVFVTHGGTTAIFICENDAWKGTAGIPEAVSRALESNGLPASGDAVPCAGSPEANWRAL